MKHIKNVQQKNVYPKIWYSFLTLPNIRNGKEVVGERRADSFMHVLVQSVWNWISINIPVNNLLPTGKKTQAGDIAFLTVLKIRYAIQMKVGMVFGTPCMSVCLCVPSNAICHAKNGGKHNRISHPFSRMDHFFIWTLRSLSKIHYVEEELEEADDEQEAGKGMISVRANSYRIKFNIPYSR